jgi:hypothetical protein
LFNLATVLQLLVVLAAMLATTLVRQSVLVREIRFLSSSSQDAKKKQRDAGKSDDGTSWSDSVGPQWPDSDHDSDSGGGGASD